MRSRLWIARGIRYNTFGVAVDCHNRPQRPFTPPGRRAGTPRQASMTTRR